MNYMSEAAKVRDIPQVMKYIRGKVLDYGCGGDKITPEATGVDGRSLPGVTYVVPDLENPGVLGAAFLKSYNTVFSSHFLEHVIEPYKMVTIWNQFLIPHGNLVLYLPDGRHYSHENNPEHLWDINYDNFLFWFKRNFCGEGKNYMGQNYPKYFELIEHGMDLGLDRYSFYIVAKAI